MNDSKKQNVLCETVVYDPSNSSVSNRWLWRNGELDHTWNELRSLITSQSEKMPGRRFTGIAAYPNSDGRVLLFRLYRSGVDQNSRPGRFFFVASVVHSSKDVVNRTISGIFHFWEKQLPDVENNRYVSIDPSGMDEAPEQPPDYDMDKIADLYHETIPRYLLWGIDESGEVCYLLAAPQSGNAEKQTKERLFSENQLKANSPNSSVLGRFREGETLFVEHLPVPRNIKKLLLWDVTQVFKKGE